MMEEKIAHLGFLQNIVSRLSGHSFSLKGWSVAVMIAIFALGGGKIDPIKLTIAILLSVIIYILDAYFLYMERKYRILYDRVSRDVSDVPKFSLNVSKVEGGVCNFLACLFSRTIILFHGAIIAGVLLIYLFGLPTSPPSPAG